MFARIAEPGACKTRLIPALGAEGAAALQQELTRRALEMAGRLAGGRGVEVEVRYAGADPDRLPWPAGLKRWCRTQVGEGLGERLREAVGGAFVEGARRVVVIGTDCPELDDTRLAQAFDALATKDAVVGPAADGGYYLLGLSADCPEVFERIDWGSDQVGRQTRERLHGQGRRVERLGELSDVDHPEDLLACRRVGGALGEVLRGTAEKWTCPLLSVVIPALQEEGALPRTLERLRGVPGVEVVVADGGSSDRTGEIAREFGARVVACRRGRGRQLNAGAAFASGETLLFLHADALLPEGFVEQVTAVLATGAIAGAFRLRIENAGLGLRAVAWGANARSRFLQLPYGDQGLFLRTSDFLRVGGFPQWPLMEDYEFCRRLKRLGRIALAPGEITVSNRRWKQLGVLRTTLLNQVCVAGFRAGVSPERLARWYAARRRPS